MNLRIQLASPPDREKIVVELWHGNQQVAEISWEANHPMLEIYPHPSPETQGIWTLELDAVLQALHMARQRLEE